MTTRGLRVRQDRAVRSFDPAANERDPASDKIDVLQTHREKLRTPGAGRYRHSNQEMQQVIVLAEPSNQRCELIRSRRLTFGLADLDAMGSLDRVIKDSSPPLCLRQRGAQHHMHTSQGS